MSRLRCHISISLDGFVAGPNQSEKDPLGEGGEQLHEWALSLAAWREPHGLQGGEVNASTPVVEHATENVGATVMGRNMFGGGRGPGGDDPWQGWWGDDPPFHMPVFVVTQHAREPVAERDSSTSCSSTWSRSCSVPARASSTTSKARTAGSSARPWSTLPA